ncbi:MAG: hypothetical protein JXJ22_14010 [Bacteroidales bacterium]|nr:hypothetical protein [Bacteroidales bacterium]
MKKLTFLAILLLTGSIALIAQAPQQFKYQAVVRDNTGTVISDQSVGIRISIIQGTVSGQAEYIETFTCTTSVFGLINLNIGTGDVYSGNFSSINWSNGPFFIKIEIDPDNGTNFQELGISQLLSVPYALHSKTAEQITGTINETDPVFEAWDKNSGIIISKNQISDLQNYITDESDPIFTTWDKSTDISITENQISDLNHFTTENETDPLFRTSAAGAISSNDIVNWNNKIDSETDGSITNELQNLNYSNDTLSISNGNSVYVPNYWNGNDDATSIMFSPEGKGTNRGIGILQLDEVSDIFGIQSYDLNAETIGPLKLALFGEHVYINDKEGWRLGNVGIGTSRFEIPSEKLEVGGMIYSNSKGFKFPDGSVQTTAAYNSFSPWKSINNDIYYNDGKVGIGTSDPDFILDIVGNAGETDDKHFLSITNTNTSTISDVAIQLKSGYNTGNQSRGTLGVVPLNYSLAPYLQGYTHLTSYNKGVAIRAHTIDGNIKFITGGNSSEYVRMNIDSDGNIGIGTSEPFSKFSVVKKDPYIAFNSNTQIADFRRNYEGHSAGVAIYGYPDIDEMTEYMRNSVMFYTMDDAKNLKLCAHQVGGTIQFITDGWDNTSYEKMRIDNTGNIGIGTIEPGSKLEVADGDIFISDINKGVIMKSPDGQCWRMTVDNSGSLISTAITCPTK